jgi:hypothetical protein
MLILLMGYNFFRFSTLQYFLRLIILRNRRFRYFRKTRYRS